MVLYVRSWWENKVFNTVIKVKVSKRWSHERCSPLPSYKREDKMVIYSKSSWRPSYFSCVSICFPNTLHCPGWTSDVMQHKTQSYLRPTSDRIKSSSVTWTSNNPRPALDAKKSSKQECSCRSVDRRKRRPRSGWGWLHETIYSWKPELNLTDASSLFNIEHHGFSELTTWTVS